MFKCMWILMATISITFCVIFYTSCFENEPLLNKTTKYAEDDFLKSWTALSPKPISDDIFSVHFANGAVVASLFGGKMLYSDNAMMTLEFYNLPQIDMLTDITDFSGSFVGVSSLGKMYKSPNGKSWSAVSGENINSMFTAVAAGDKVIAVGFGGLIVSSADLNTYTKKTSGIQSNLYDIAVSESNSYVAVGQNSVVCRSSDGNTFNCSNTVAGADIISVAYGAGKFVAVTANYKFMVSNDDGASWTISDLGFTGDISRIEYFNDEFIIYGLNGLIATSKTGNSFTKVNVSSAYAFYDAAYDGSLYYFVGPGGLALTSSHPSLGFLKISPDIAGDLYALYKGWNYYVVGGKGGTVAYSIDGLDFTLVASTEIDKDIIAIASDKEPNNERFCAVTNGGFVYRTNDVTGEWTGYHLAGSNDFSDITFALSKFILVGTNGTLYISGDCVNFLKVETGSSANFRRVLFDGTNILIAGDSGTLYKSTNPSGPYSKVNFPVSYNIVDLAYGNRIYLLLTIEKVGASSYNSRIYKSTDMSNFALAKEYPNIRLTRTAFGAGYFIFTSNTGNVYYTKDGDNYLVTYSGKYKEILSASFMEKAFYLSGKDAILLKSGDNLSGLEPQISVSKDSIDFGEVVINSSSDMEEIVVSNLGKGNLSINAILITGTNSNQFMIVSDSCSTATLSEGGECRIYVDFRPTSTGIKSAKLDIASNDKTHPTYSVNLTGKGVPPSQGAISVDKSVLDFGVVKIGMESQPQTVTVKNVGTKNLEVSDVYIQGDDSSDFEIKSENCRNVSLSPNSTCTINVSFKPSSMGNKSAELLIDSDDPNRPTAKVLLSGSGIDINYPNITVDKNQIDFGTVKVGSESAVQSLTVTNSGSTFLVISDVKTEGGNATDFVIKTDECKGKSLTPSSSCKIDMTFKPQSAGNATSALKISSNDPDTPVYSVNLYGTGRAAGGPAINVTPMSLDFGKVNVGTESAAQDVIITSVGDTDLTLNSQSFAGDNYDNFRIAGVNCPFKLAPNQSCKVSVVFAPKNAGLKNAVLRIGSDDPLYQNVDVSLKGEGVVNKPVMINVTPPSYDFGERIIGKAYPPVTFTVKNEGTGNLTIDSVLLDGDDTDSFKIESDDCSGNQFTPDGLCHIKLNFSPREEKSYSIKIVINSNDSSTPRLDVPVKGKGIKEVEKDAGTTTDIAIEIDSGYTPLTDTRSTDTSESGCGCSIIE